MRKFLSTRHYSPEVLALHVSVREDGRAYVTTYDHRRRSGGLPHTVTRRLVRRASGVALEYAVREGLSDLWSTLPDFGPVD